MFAVLNTFLLLSVLVVAVPRKKEAWSATSSLCKASCLNQLLDPEDAKVDGGCAGEADCFVCWEHCETLAARNSSRAILCNDQCSVGCEVACDFFQKPKPASAPSELLFPEAPKLVDDRLEWKPVPNASLYNVLFYFANNTIFKVTQTVSCAVKISRPQLARINTIVVVAVNHEGAVGIVNYYKPKRLVKKNISSSSLLLRNNIFPASATVNLSEIHNLGLWITQNQIVKLDKTLVKANISWEYFNKGDYKKNHQYMIKWWIPDLSMEGKLMVNGSQSTELVYRMGHICLVKVKVIGTEIESPIKVLKKEYVDLTAYKNYSVSNLKGLLIGGILVLSVIFLLLFKLITVSTEAKLNNFEMK